MMDKVLSKTADLGDACCGCGACAAACLKRCISMQEDACGFQRPHIDFGACVGCGLCERVCPALSERGQDEALSVWWVRAKGDGLLERSSSGGVFGLLARDCLERGGAVYGAAFTEDLRRVRHVRVDSVEGLDAVMRSKYLQSSVGRDAYEGVAFDLRAGLPVLFSGTACQVAGVKRYLDAKRVDQSDLLLADVICHGVPSPKLWEAWVEWNERQQHGMLSSMNFRSKANGWSTYSLRYGYEGGDGSSHAVLSSNGDDWYMKAFLSNASLRSSCFSCPAKRSCGSDVTLGDFWGIQEQHPEAMSERGVSAVIVSTEKGEQAIRRILPFAEHGESTFNAILSGNPSLVSSSRPYRGAGEFMRDVEAEVPMSEMMSRWNFKFSIKDRVVFLIRRLGKKMHQITND